MAKNDISNPPSPRKRISKKKPPIETMIFEIGGKYLPYMNDEYGEEINYIIEMYEYIEGYAYNISNSNKKILLKTLGEQIEAYYTDLTSNYEFLEEEVTTKTTKRFLVEK